MHNLFEPRENCRTLTGAWIETPQWWSHVVGNMVAPSRVRGLKRCTVPDRVCEFGRTLTGAWIETLSALVTVLVYFGRTLTGAWIETSFQFLS